MKRDKKQPKYNMWQNTAYMMKLAWQTQKSVIFLCIAIALLSVCISILELYVAPVILNEVTNKTPLMNLLKVIMQFTLTLMLVSGIRAYLNQNTLFGRVEVRTKIVEQVHYKLCTTSYPHLKEIDFQKLTDKAFKTVNANQEATEAIWATLTELLQNILGFVVFLMVISSLNSLLLLVVVVTSVVGYFINRRINEWEYRHREEEFAYNQKLTYINYKAQDITLAKDIRIFGMQPWLEEVYQKTLKLRKAFIKRREMVYLWTNIVDVVLTLTRNGVAYYYLILMVIDGTISVASFLLYFNAINGFTTWITGILSSFSLLHLQSLDLSLVREFLEYEEPFSFENGEPLKKDLNTAYEIELRNVSFRYPNALKDTIHHLNLVIHPGEKLAIVGLNGAGKTTLVKLICGLYDPSEGEVLLNGQNIKSYNRKDYYQMFSAVFQQFSILETTILENIEQTDQTIDERKALVCLEKAGLKEKIEKLPNSIHTHIGRKVYEDGIQMSGGEMQRLMLARALYKDAPIILLDEPTAALDPIAENDIYMKYHEMTLDKTSVFISHRLASTRFCDRIILLSDGDILEEGNHDELMAMNKKYASLFRVQSKYYQEGRDF